MTCRTVFWLQIRSASHHAIERVKNSSFRALAMVSQQNREAPGVKVSALNADIDTENAMVGAKCRNKIPVVPGKSATARTPAN
jgi:hypothetical protein